MEFVVIWPGVPPRRPMAQSDTFSLLDLHSVDLVHQLFAAGGLESPVPFRKITRSWESLVDVGSGRSERKVHTRELCTQLRLDAGAAR